MKYKEFEGYKYIVGGVCAAKGFKASGVHCGLVVNPKKNDLGMVFCDKKCSAAAVYTTNKVKGAPLIVTKKHLADGKAQAVIVNSKNANTCNIDGEQKAQMMTELAAKALKINADDVIVASTGVIGQILPIKPIEDNIERLASLLSENGNEEAAKAIMTTDTIKKEVAVEFKLGDKICHLGGMAKGSGMIHPNMATTLNFITTDVDITAEMLQKALSKVVKVTYNCLSVDGDTSTNDMVTVLASGYANNTLIDSENDDYKAFEKALYIVMMNLTKLLAKDGEGASKLLECTVHNADNQDMAIIVAKSVICSNLLKAAMFGSDANWGRILCAIGYAPCEFDINKVDVYLSSVKGKIQVCKDGSGVEFSEDKAKKILLEDEINIDVDLNCGNAEATAWGCDLTYDYVKINGDYRS